MYVHGTSNECILSHPVLDVLFSYQKISMVSAHLEKGIGLLVSDTALLISDTTLLMGHAVPLCSWRLIFFPKLIESAALEWSIRPTLDGDNSWALRIPPSTRGPKSFSL